MTDAWSTTGRRPDEPDEEDDAALIAAARRDPAAFGLLYSRHVRSIYRYCYRRLGRHELAEDATSATFTKALGAVDRYQDETFRGWLFTIAKRVVTDLQRRQRPGLGIDAAAELMTTEPGPEAQVVAAENQRSVRAMLARLTDEQREIVELRLAGLTGPEIAHVLGKRPEAIKSAQYRAYAQLRKFLKSDEGGLEQ